MSNNTIDDGGPAFPRGGPTGSYGGLTKRELFAVINMAALQLNPELMEATHAKVAQQAVCAANALLAALKEPR